MDKAASRKQSFHRQSTDAETTYAAASSMLPLRAALAEAKAAAAERRGTEERDTKVRGGKKRVISDRKEDETVRQNKGVRERIQCDERIYSSKTSSKRWKDVKKSLEGKAKIYDEMMAMTAEQQDYAGGQKAERENLNSEDILIDFERKKVSPTVESHNGSSQFAPIQDEFGREIYVPFNSTECRKYIAEEARKLRLEEIQRTRSQEQNEMYSYEFYSTDGKPHEDFFSGDETISSIQQQQQAQYPQYQESSCETSRPRAHDPQQHTPPSDSSKNEKLNSLQQLIYRIKQRRKDRLDLILRKHKRMHRT